MPAQLVAEMLLKTDVCSLVCKKGQSNEGYFASFCTFGNTLQNRKKQMRDVRRDGRLSQCGEKLICISTVEIQDFCILCKFGNFTIAKGNFRTVVLRNF